MTALLDSAEVLLADLVGFASISCLPNDDIVTYIKSYFSPMGLKFILMLMKTVSGSIFLLVLAPRRMAAFFCQGTLMWCPLIRLAGHAIHLFFIGKMDGFMGVAQLI